MTEPRWLSPEDVEILQRIAIEKDGGLSGGLTKPGLLESALSRPQNEYAYAGEQDVFKLAATYAEGIAQNHAFADANKRTALLAAAKFLEDNGHDLQAAKGREHADMMVNLTEGKITREDAAAHLKEHSREIQKDRIQAREQSQTKEKPRRAALKKKRTIGTGREIDRD